MAMLEYIVAGLHQPETMMPAVQELGRRHADYGVQEAHDATVGTALLGALRQGLGPQCIPAVEAAWAAAYTLLVDTMQAATAASAYGAEAMQTATSAEG
jgi:hemoglobin-like flavoprotein